MQLLDSAGKAESEKVGEHVFRVGISGSYGGLNLGDEAILQVIATELSQAFRSS
jgi:hypothetical protein